MSAPDNQIEREQEQIARSLRLRGPAPPVTRVSRKALIVTSAILSLALAGAVAWSLTDHPRKPSPQAQAVPLPPPERISTLPRDYLARGAVPKLGPPLPGDLGRPMLSAQTEGAAVMTPLTPQAPAPVPTADPIALEQRQSREAARSSPLFLQVRVEPPVALPAAPRPPAAPPPIADDRAVSPERLQSPASPYIVQAGSIISAALITGLRSDVQGVAVAQVTQDVYDSLGGGFLLVPAGSRLVGSYASESAAGQSRLAVAWTRLILPSGRSIMLDKLPASDAQGMAGLHDKVDRRWGSVWASAALSTVMAVGAEAGGSDDDDLVRAMRRGVSGAVTDVGQQAVGRSLQLTPRLSIRPGAPLRVVVARDLVLEPYWESAR